MRKLPLAGGLSTENSAASASSPGLTVPMFAYGIAQEDTDMGIRATLFGWRRHALGTGRHQQVFLTPDPLSHTRGRIIEVDPPDFSMVKQYAALEGNDIQTVVVREEDSGELRLCAAVILANREAN